MSRFPSAALITLLCGLAASRPASADTITWTGGGNGNWSGASSFWTPHGPGAGDDVILNALANPNQNTAYTVTVPAGVAADANSVAINAATATLRNNGTGATFNIGTLTLSLGTFNQAGGSLNVGTLAATGGTFTLTTGTTTLGAGGGTVSGAGLFAFSNGTLAGGPLAVNNGGFTWDNGTLQSTLNLNNGGALISGQGTKILDAGSALNFNGGTTTFVGTIKYIGNGAITVGTGATLNIQADVDITKDTAYSGPASFTVLSGATLLRNTSTGTARIHAGLTFANAGTIRASTGTLEIDASLNNTGTLQTDAGATTWTGGATASVATLTLNAGSAITGTGTFLLQAATGTAGFLDLQADTAAASTVYLHTGTVQGTKTLTVNGPLTWRNGIIGGSATVKATGGGTVIGSGTVSTGTMQLNAGTYAWSTGTITFAGNGRLQIDAGATLSNTGNNNFAVSSGSPVIQNDGTFERTAGAGTVGTGTGTFNNTNLIRILTGRLSVQGTLNNTGTLSVAAGAGLAMGGGTLNLNAGSDITGAGLLTVDSSSSTLSVNAATNATTSLAYVRGLITGTAALTVNGSFDFGLFDGNSVAGSVTVNAAGGGDWTSGGTRRIGTGAVNLTGGTTTWTGADIAFTGTGVLTVANGATLNLTGDQSITRSAGGPAVTVNGLFRKSAGTGTGTVAAGIAFTVGATGTVDAASGTMQVQTDTINNGTLKASTGTLTINAPIALTGTGLVTVQAAGTLTVAPGTTGTTTLLAGMTLSNAGTVQATAGTFAVAAGAMLTNYSAATSTLTGGTWLATDAKIDFGGRAVSTIAPNTTVELSGGGAAVIGLAALTQNNGKLRLSNNAALAPTGGSVAAAGALDVSGTLTAAVTVQSQGSLSGGGIVNGPVAVQAGGTVSPGPGPYTAPGAGAIALGNTALNGGTVYVWELGSWSGSASPGADYDQIRGLNGKKLDLAGASAANRITLHIVSLNGSAAGTIAAFDPAQSRSWVIADFSDGNAAVGVLNFSADKFTLDTSAFANQVNSTNFSLLLDANSNQLILTYSPVPEPWGLLLSAAAALGAARRRSL